MNKTLFKIFFLRVWIQFDNIFWKPNYSSDQFKHVKEKST